MNVLDIFNNSERKNIIIYGKNDSGKTYMIYKVARHLIDNNDVNFNIITTNRLKVSDVFLKAKKVDEFEYKIELQKKIYGDLDYDVHLKRIRLLFLNDKIIDGVLGRFLHKVFNKNININDSYLSDGVVNIINIYLEILWSFNYDNQDGKVILNKKKIIIIDEIELYLHVSIQNKILDILNEEFPLVTFIVTTHSPLIIARCNNAKLYVAEKNELTHVEDNLYYQDLDIINKEYFDVSLMPKKINTMLEEISDAVSYNKPLNKNQYKKYIEEISSNYSNIFKEYTYIINYYNEVFDV